MKNTILGGLIIIFGSAVIIALCPGRCYLIVSGLWYLICLGALGGTDKELEKAI